MTDEELQVAKALVKDASYEPWVLDGYGAVVIAGAPHDFKWPSDAEFIAAARTLVPKLLAEVERLRTEINRLNNNAACRRRMVREAVLRALDSMPGDE